MMPGNSASPAASFFTRLSRTSFLTERRGNASGDASRARRSSPRVWIFEIFVIRMVPKPILMHPALASTRPLVFAHRGGSRLAPENTIAAFDRGMAAGADGLELDVRLSRDGVAVVHHDPLLDRTTRATG